MPEEYVSMHHRIRKALRRRLKLASVEAERPVTDIVNEAIESWLKDNALPGARQEHLHELDGASVLEKVEWLRDCKEQGNLYSSAASLQKNDLVEILGHFGKDATLRLSGDRLVTMLVPLI